MISNEWAYDKNATVLLVAFTEWVCQMARRRKQKSPISRVLLARGYAAIHLRDKSGECLV